MAESLEADTKVWMDIGRPEGSVRVEHSRVDAEGPMATATQGELAPDFELVAATGDRVALRDFRGSPAVLVFYPADWSPVCGDQVTLYNEVLPEFHEYGAELLGISVDGVWCHSSYAQDKKLHFSLLSDFEPKGAVARLYGAYREGDGTSERALFVIG